MNTNKYRAPAELVMQLHQRTAMSVLEAKQFLESANDLLRSRVIEALASQSDDRWLNDPIEFHPDFQDAFSQADKRTQVEMAHEKRRMGLIHLFWHTKQRILLEKFGIEWFTPAQMNPHIYFD